MKQDYLCYHNDQICIVRGQIDGEILMQSADAHQALQAAIDACDGGGEVTVARGRYELARPLSLRSGVTLRGSGRGSQLIVAAHNESGVAVSGTEAHGLSIRDLVIAPFAKGQGSSGLVLERCGSAEVDGLFVAGFAEHGIKLMDNTFLTRVSRCTAAVNGKSNIFLGEQYRGKYGDFIPNLVTDCVVYGGGHGIECVRAIVLNIVGCVAYQTGGHAFYVHGNSNSVLISGCRSFQITGCAVRVDRSDELNVSSNIFCWHTEHGLHVTDTCWGVVSANNFIDNGSYNSGTKDLETTPADIPKDVPLFCGVQLSGCKGFNVAGNTIFNWQQALKMRHGIELDAACEACSISHNNVNYYQGEAVLDASREGMILNNVGVADKPHHPIPPQGRDFVQSFRPEVIDGFIDELFGFHA